MFDPVSGHIRADVVSGSIVLASSSGLGWEGLSAEVGQSRVFEPDGVVMAGHNLAMNVASRPLQLEVKGAHGFQRVTLAPKSFWIHPGRTPFALRILGPARYGCVQISLSKARRLLGADVEVRPAFGLVDERLSSIARLILLETCSGGPCEKLYIEGLEIALLARLRQLCAPQRPEGSLGAARLKLVHEYIEEKLDEPLTTEDMAAVAGVSPAHFAREFKRATGKTPHAFVVGRRIERARKLLVGGGSIADTAVQCGFTDQAHLSRLFKRHLGVTPGAFVRRVGR
jgi:AraC family transcriptional regulator